MISDYIQKINQYLHPDTQYTTSSSQPNSSLIFQLQLKKSQQHLSKITKNTHKIQQLILQNDQLKHQITLQTKTIQTHLKKEIELKYIIATLQDQLQILNEKLIIQQALRVKQNAPQQNMHQKQFYKLHQKLSNCIQQNEILRSQNQSYRAKQFIKEQNFRIIELKFNQNLNSMTQQINLLKTDLQLQTSKALLLQKIQAQNHMLKVQNKRIQSMMEIKLQEYQAKIQLLIGELETQRFGKEMVREKYEELTGIIQVVDEMRHQFKTKKKSIEFGNQQNALLNNIQFTPAFPLPNKTKKPIKKSTNNKQTKQNQS